MDTILGIGLTTGIAVGLLLIAYGVFFRRLGQTPDSPAAWIFYVLLLLAVVASNWQLRGPSGVALLDGLAAGVLVAAIGSVLYCIYVYAANRRDGWLLEYSLAKGTERITRQELSDEVREKRLRRLQAICRPGPFAALIFLQLVVFGTVVSLVSALVI